MSEIIHIPSLVAEEFGISTSEARRCIGHGGVRLDDRVLSDLDLYLESEAVDGKELRLGTRRLTTVTLNGSPRPTRHEQEEKE